MTELEVLGAIDYVVAILAPKFRFGQYDLDDIKQEARLLAWEALPRFDQHWKDDTEDLVNKLKSFLYVHVRNRLINLKRDQLGRTVEKQSVTCALSIDNIDDQDEQNMHLDDKTHDMVFLTEVKEKIVRKLPPELLPYYKKMLAEAPVSKVYRTRVCEAIKKILSNEYPI